MRQTNPEITSSRGGRPPAVSSGGAVRIAAEWEDTDDRLAARKAAARAVPDYAREHGTVSKQEAKEAVSPEHPVADQNLRTWYRKNVRPVLNGAAEYDQSARAYRLTDV